jgi:dipeptidyl aminopeptidase/acylaminoacyl peptidase
MHAHKVSTATLNICRALDRCTPSEEARQFHSALVENGVESILVTYSEEGHGVRKLPASVDYAVRLVSWIVERTNNPAAANAT